MQDTVLGPQGVHNRGVPLYMSICAAGYKTAVVIIQYYVCKQASSC